MMKTHNNPVPHSPALTGGKRPHLLRKALGLLALSAAAFWGTACSSDELDALSGAGSGGAVSRVPSYVSLRIATPSATPAVKRDNPTGGEDGDGRETGQTNENSISTVTAFFYDADDDFTNANTDANFSAIVTFGEGDIRTVSEADEGENIDIVYTTSVVETSLEPGAYKVLIIANGGRDIAGLVGSDQTFSSVRDRLCRAAWSESSDGEGGTSYSDFVMTSVDERNITITDENTNVNNPATAEVTVQRLAARVDYRAEQNNNFEISTDKGADYNGTVTITGLALANNLTAGEYYFKRVTSEGQTSSTLYFGKETETGGVPTNYVRDPWFLQKTAANTDLGRSPFELHMGQNVTNAEGLYAEGHYLPTDCQSEAGFWSQQAVEGTPVGTEGYRIAAYTMENTLLNNSPLENYATAAVFKARFEPTGLTGYTSGDTFFAWNGNLYLDLEDIMRAFWYNTYDDSQKAITDAQTWDDVRSAVSGLPVSDPTGYRDWVLDQVADAAVSTPDPAALTWKAYAASVLGYEKTEDAAGEIDLNDVDTQAALANYGVRTYRHSECYYTCFIKHGNDNIDENDGVDAAAHGIMEYGIVRNNVYKLSVHSVANIGGDVPDPEYSLRLRVYVKAWTLLEEETLPM